MSFGYGISDLITTSTLAWRIYKSCKDSSESFKSISSEVASLHIVLKEIEESLSGQSLNSSLETQLRTLGDGCSDVLNDLNMLVEKYNSLGTNSQRTWDRMRWGWEDIQSTRERLISNITMLNAFNGILINSSQARVEEKLNQLIAEIRAGKREGSIVTTDSIGSLSVEDKETWRQLRRELEDIGISTTVLKQHQQFIVTWLEKAARTGALEGVTDNRGAIVHVTSDNGDEGEPLSPDLDRERTFDARTSTRSSSDSEATVSRALQAHQTLDASTNERSGNRSPLRTRFRHVMNRLLVITPEAFFNAVKQEDIERVKELLTDPGLDINSRNGKKQTALHLAAYTGNRDLAKLLLDTGAKIEAKDRKRRTALLCGAFAGHSGLVGFLRDNGADIEAEDERGTTVLSYAACNGHLEAVALLLTMGADVRSSDCNKSTALHNAAFGGHATVVELLLKRGAVKEATTRFWSTALSIAASEGHFEAVEMLLKNKANTNAKDKDGRTALHEASLRGHTNVVELLLSSKEVNVNEETFEKLTALSFAASNNHYDVVKLLIQKGASVNVRGPFGEGTVLHQAIFRGDSNMVKVLLDNGVSIDAYTLQHAISHGILIS